ncbi:MAG: hypothetical protein BWX88_04449 [Planctomycetes bacterium ADurb.Bin126]|nr:MAG: hypothetical protein BWX88_04449 [Planctomycetes bacterium ADurb.Bin126]HOD82840.1 tetratricopeptide repeat protein [Phycisphaerae bacterium]HQL75554.1 tetratricopeptide repeat protein [Phycisphaerae bacterium]
MLRNLLVGVFVISCLAHLAWAGSKSVRLKDGRVLTGEVTKTDDGYVIKMAFGEQTVKAGDVVSIVDVITPEEEFKQRFAKLDKKDPDARYALAQWAFRNNLMDEAKSECEAALDLQPKFERAELLMRQINAKVGQTKPPPRGDQDNPGASLDPRDLKGVFLSEEDIFRIRLVEARFSPSRVDEGPRGWDDNVSIVFRNKALETFVEGMAGKPPFDQREFANRFRTWRNPEKLSFMLKRLKEAGCEEVRDDIEIRQNPRVMIEFRSRVWPIVSGYCGSAQCHGGEKINGGFRLFNVVGRGDEIDYTNFLMLVATRVNKRRVVDRSQYEQSLLLQFGLPETLAEFKHPKTRPPLFKGKQDPKYGLILSWMKALAGTRMPDYHLKWTPPAGLKIQLTDTSGFDLLDRPAAQPKTPAKTGGGVDDLPVRKE